MNIGIISIRYATALFRYCEYTGGSERVCAQARRLLSRKETAPVKLEPELERFTELLIRRGRLDCARFILSSFVSMYYKSRGVLEAFIITAVPAPPQLVAKLRGILEGQRGTKVHFETIVDESIIGGFIVQLDSEYILDASVWTQLESIRRQFVVQNTRIV